MVKSGRRFRYALVFGCTAILSGGGVSAPRAQNPSASAPPDLAAPAPLPERNPLRTKSSPHPGQIETPDWSAQEIQEATDSCAMMLADSGIEYRFLAPIREGRCGTPSPIELSSIGKRRTVTIDPPARVTCGLAAALSAWADNILQPSARRHLNREITHIRNVASYVCRNRYNASDKPISEHARANALDMAAFKTQSGDWIQVLDHWALPPDADPAPVISGTTIAPPAPSPVSAAGPIPAGQPPSHASGTDPRPFEPRSAFLYEIHEGACTLFGTVLGPEANDAHKDHFHYDLAARKHGAYCE